MVRTQIYLTKEEINALKSISKRHGKSQSELIRVAVDDLIIRHSARRRYEILERFAGIWKNKDNLRGVGKDS
jgi:hypothetical protein